MSPDEIALLRAIRDAPDNDLPRFVYADWLEEHAGTAECPSCSRLDPGWAAHMKCCKGGHISDGRRERAEFIRVQVELAADPKRVRCTCAACDEGNGVVCFVRQRERILWMSRGWSYLPSDWQPSFSVHIDQTVPHDPGGATIAVVRRGFVESVRCDLATWMGGECGRCGGHGRIVTGLPTVTDSKCPGCHGTGYTGIGPQVVACQPVTRVVTDREPNDYGPPEDGRRFGWVRESSVWQLHMPFVLPAALYDILRELPDWNEGRYPTRAAALDALSTALILWANNPHESRS